MKENSCSFCANPPELIKVMFTPVLRLGSEEPISDVRICETCLMQAHNTLIAWSSEKARKQQEDVRKRFPVRLSRIPYSKL